ncbi:sugar phosphate isomerase/epimerase family protein [Ktedonobacter racemifer]|uniref:Xylose isomerase domain protein TIM barrel n=1 Tax=Ktedonobacter racemifer DSM 44963 TaxID=485913 RepID=D6TTA3_KTERA|nr:sugar phosphate isomerase/epimerase [Ktedonobacter racemifer]EFH83654.1 Xylose isomerase domain protein TIM barrel [Ktedonobacter racemifer DSM 44963]
MFRCLNTGALSLSVHVEEALGLASRHGFAGLDLPIGELFRLAEASSVQEVKDLFHSTGVCAGSWAPPVDYYGDEASYRAGLELLPAYAKFAQELGSPRCCTWVKPFSDTLEYEANLEFHIQRLRPIARILADYGCRFGLEFVGAKTFRAGHRYEFISTLQGVLDLGERIATGNVGLLLDSFHWYTSHGSSEDLTYLSIDQVVSVHLNDAPDHRSVDEQIDNQRLLPGTSGKINIADFLQVLKRMHYEGPVVVEPFNAELAKLPADERVDAVKQSLDKVWALAGLA